MNKVMLVKMKTPDQELASIVSSIRKYQDLRYEIKAVCLTDNNESKQITIDISK